MSGVVLQAFTRRITRARQLYTTVVHVRRARFAAEDEAAARLPPRRVRRTTGASVVLSIRADPAELAALERQAAVIGIKPTVLARNLVRAGLSCPGSNALVHAVDQLDAAVTQLHSLVH